MRDQTLAKIFTATFHQNWEEQAFSDFDGGDYYYKDIAATIKSLHLFYQLAGLQRGDKIAVLGRNSSHWAATFLSAISAGLVIVPILPDFNKNDTNHIINHSESKLVIGATALLEKVDLTLSENLQAIVKLEDFSFHSGIDENIRYKLNDGFQYYKENKLSKEAFVFEEWEPEEMCIISYTSGTSGFTKGVMIPERSLLSNIIFAREHMPLEAGNKIVSFLPMAHVYGLLFEFLFPVSKGCHITFLSKMPSPAVITKAFGEIKPHLILSVPLVIEKIYKKRILPAIEKPAVKIMLKVPIISNIILKKIRTKMIETFGGRFFEIVIGGAPLSADVEAFFKRINFPFTIGYGMTECGPLISYESWDKTMPSSAGTLVDRMEVRIDSEDPYSVVGEIQVKGENVMLGYFKNEKETKAVLTEDGWLKTGDLGVIDQNNFIYIRGRSKNMLLGPSGQNIYPEEIEAKLSNQSYIAECVVVERDHKLVALVYPDFESMKTEGINEKDLPEIMADNRKKANSELPRYENVSRIELVDTEFDKTPKRNIKRYKYI
ncbi:AMP-binding protein [Draconibacterium halophilum]|uniref:Long-chain fatty acid--CoA ligase n=1 Tax=Draconibacterium halophilum TaxID=2706887 RepID=A0A6C0R8R2_9BACT|nr:AMP-binding protein [Draconibacterium halophilum]QIA06848.1 long-chain fatty acid--CoA ligase [Draconibacterium halophilum]